MFLSGTLAGEPIGVLPIDEHFYTRYFAVHTIARFDSRKQQILALPKAQKRFVWAWRKGRGRVPSPCTPSGPRGRSKSVRNVPGLKCQVYPRQRTGEAWNLLFPPYTEGKSPALPARRRRARTLLQSGALRVMALAFIPALSTPLSDFACPPPLFGRASRIFLLLVTVHCKLPAPSISLSPQRTNGQSPPTLLRPPWPPPTNTKTYSHAQSPAS